MELHLKVIGILFISLALAHSVFPRYFHWQEELTSLSVINRQIMKVHTFFIALTVFLMGLLCLTSSYDLLHTALGKKICLGLAVFWAIRFYLQFFGYSKETWQGKKLETCLHILASLFWAYLTIIFSMAYCL